MWRSGARRLHGGIVSNRSFSPLDPRNAQLPCQDTLSGRNKCQRFLGANKTPRIMKYVLIVNDGVHRDWYYYATAAELFSAWQGTDRSTMWEKVGGQLVRLVCSYRTLHRPGRQLPQSA